MSKETVVTSTYSDKEVVMRHGANEAMSSSKILVIPVDVFMQIWDYDWNPGGRADNDFLSLYDEITTVGMNTKPVISSRVPFGELQKLLKGTKSKAVKALRGIRGHLRSKVVAKYKDANPEQFKKLWGDGIVCEVIAGINTEQEYYLACDHNTVSRDKVAVVKQGMLMFKRGCSEKDVILQLWDELTSVFNDLGAKRKVAIAAATTIKAKIREMTEARHGAAQMFKRLAQLPAKVFGAWENGERGVEGAKIAHTDLINLVEANKGGTVHDATPAFEKLYTLCTTEYGKPTPQGPKIMSVKQMDYLFTQIGSNTLKALFFKIRFSNEMDLIELDALLMTLEQEATIEAALFAEVEQESVKLKAAAAAKAAKASDAA